MSVLTKKHRTKDSVIQNISFDFKGKHRVYKNLFEIPLDEAKIIEQAIEWVRQSVRSGENEIVGHDWDGVFKKSRDRIGGITAYRKTAARLRGARFREGYTQEKLAKKLGIRQSNLSAIETAKAPVGKRLAMKFAKVFKSDYRLFLTDLPK